jgi:hypothetical protein
MDEELKRYLDAMMHKINDSHERPLDRIARAGFSEHQGVPCRGRTDFVAPLAGSRRPREQVGDA